MKAEKRNKHTYGKNTNRIRKLGCIFTVAVFFLVYTSDIPLTQSYFNSEGEADPITLTVTEDFFPIVFRGSISMVQEKERGSNMQLTDVAETSGSAIDIAVPSFDDILLVIHCEEGYQAEELDKETIVISCGDLAVPYSDIRTEGDQIIFVFDYDTVLQLLGYGRHVINASGVFLDGWTQFQSEDDIEFIDYEQIARQKAEEQLAEQLSQLTAEIDRLIAQAEQYLSQGDSSGALASCNEALSLVNRLPEERQDLRDSYLARLNALSAPPAETPAEEGPLPPQQDGGLPPQEGNPPPPQQNDELPAGEDGQVLPQQDGEQPPAENELPEEEDNADGLPEDGAAGQDDETAPDEDAAKEPGKNGDTTTVPEVRDISAPTSAPIPTPDNGEGETNLPDSDDVAKTLKGTEAENNDSESNSENEESHDSDSDDIGSEGNINNREQ